MRTMLIFLAIMLLALPYFSSAQIPRTISYQGVLTDTTGKAKPDGKYLFTFRLYGSEGLGKALWTEPDKALEVKGGLFSTQLGSVVPFGALVDFQKQYWLGIEVGSEGELSPRVPFSSVAYGFRSINTDTADIALSVADTSITTSALKNSVVTSGKIAAAQVVKSINTLKDSVTLLAGTNVSITPSGNTLTISASGGGSGNVSGTGASPQVAFWTGASTVAGDNALRWDNTNKCLGIGGTYSAAKLYAVAPTGYAIYGTATDADGVVGRTLNAAYAGVYGEGKSWGVYGRSTDTVGVGVGVYGTSRNGAGVHGSAPTGGVLGDASATSGVVYGVLGRTSSDQGYAIAGSAQASSGDCRGVYGVSFSSSGTGVYGNASAISGSTYGVRGLASSPTGYGVYGESLTRGVWGSSTVGSGWAVGTYGTCASTSGYGVYGAATATSGATCGVVGYNLSPAGYGVYGYAGASSGETRGVMGVCTSPAGAGVYGLSSASGGSTWGVFGENRSTEGAGVVGWASSSSGNTFGVWGLNDSPAGRAVYAYATAGGTAVYCDGKFYQTGGVFEAHPTSVVWSGTKPATVKLNDGTKVKLFTEEAAELYFTDYGQGRLSGGSVHVELDGTYLQTVTIDARHPMKVFVQLEGDCRGVYVANKTATGFDVVELQGGKSSATFSYRVVCKRKYYEDERLATEEQDVQYNSRMLETVWPEVVSEQKGGEAAAKVMKEQRQQMREQDLKTPETQPGPPATTGR